MVEAEAQKKKNGGRRKRRRRRSQNRGGAVLCWLPSEDNDNAGGVAGIREKQHSSEGLKRRKERKSVRELKEQG